ncbi:MAG: hypothetical protein ACYTHM_24130 [Planctomycetota bacterium]|jgi:YHS domain-containing protein
MKNLWIGVFALGAVAGAFLLLQGCTGDGAGAPADVSSETSHDPKSHGQPAKAGASVAEADLKDQETCPVMGGAIDRNVYVDHEGMRVYFCCAGCGPEFKKDPEKYLKKLKDLGEQPEYTP